MGEQGDSSHSRHVAGDKDPPINDSNSQQHNGDKNRNALKIAPTKVLTDSSGQPATPQTPHTPAVKHAYHTSALLSPSSISSSPGQPQSPDPVPDLPAELLEAGWGKFWSRREGRPYFFNKLTNESRWEMPGTAEPNEHDPLSDPLGINLSPPSSSVSGNSDSSGSGQPASSVSGQSASSGSGQSASLVSGQSRSSGSGQSASSVSGQSRSSVSGQSGSAQSAHPSRSVSVDAKPPTQGVKRRSSEDVSLMTPAKKMAFSYKPFWNFDIPTNVMIWERKPCYMPPPLLDIEVMRAEVMAKLRAKYQDMCHTREGIDAPRESFNRWLLERQLVDKGEDPMLPSRCTPEISQSMYREIINDIPVKLVKPKYYSDARRQLFKYSEAASSLIEKRGKSPESRKVVKWHATEMIDWLRNAGEASYEDFLERLAHLKRQCQPHIMEAAKSSVEDICLKIYKMSAENVGRIMEKHWQLLAEQNIYPSAEAPPPPRRKLPCYSVQMVLPTPKMTGMERTTDGEYTLLRYKSDTLRLSTPHFHKLEQLYRWSCRDDRRFENFVPRVWCLLRRYHTMFGVRSGEGNMLQGALPVSVFDCLHRVFGVTFECFASPLNCYFKQYCSAFADIDSYFGSRGRILDFHPISGSFEANPPFCEELMAAMVDHFESLLDETSEPLSFIIFIPEWRDPPTEALVRLESSRFTKKAITLQAHAHEYRQGFQHICPKSEENIKAVHGTLIIFLQNEAGFNKWGPTPERVNELLLAYRPSDSPS